MRVNMSYDKPGNAWIIRCEHAILRTPGDVDEWKALVVAEVDKAAGPWLLELDGLEVDMSVKDAYSRLLRELDQRYPPGLVPYGRGRGFTNTVLMLDGLRRPSRTIYPDRASAVAALTQGRHGPAPQRHAP